MRRRRYDKPNAHTHTHTHTPLCKPKHKHAHPTQHEKLFYTLKAANYMNIGPLRDLCCAAIANMLRGKNEQEIYDLFNIDEPFTQQEEERLYQEFEWLREKRD